MQEDECKIILLFCFMTVSATKSGIFDAKLQSGLVSATKSAVFDAESAIKKMRLIPFPHSSVRKRTLLILYKHWHTAS